MLILIIVGIAMMIGFAGGTAYTLFNLSQKIELKAFEKMTHDEFTEFKRLIGKLK